MPMNGDDNNLNVNGKDERGKRENEMEKWIILFSFILLFSFMEPKNSLK